MKITWERRGGYEVNSRGDKRFSAFNARLEDGRCIEEHYQCDSKGYDPGGTNWRLGKGKRPLIDVDYETQYQDYLALWRRWAHRNPALMEELRQHAMAHKGILSDCFASSAINQARALADLLNEVSEYHDFSTFD